MMTDGVFRDSEASSLARRMQWGAWDAPEAAHERCWCQLVGTHAAADQKLLVSQVATSNNVAGLSPQMLVCAQRQRPRRGRYHPKGARSPACQMSTERLSGAMRAATTSLESRARNSAGAISHRQRQRRQRIRIRSGHPARDLEARVSGRCCSSRRRDCSNARGHGGERDPLQRHEHYKCSRSSFV